MQSAESSISHQVSILKSGLLDSYLTLINPKQLAEILLVKSPVAIDFRGHSVPPHNTELYSESHSRREVHRLWQVSCRSTR